MNILMNVKGDLREILIGNIHMYKERERESKERY